jgi:hypothetical protein
MKKQLQAFLPGTHVHVANDIGLFTIIRRVRPNVYLVAYKGHEVELYRSHLKLPAAWFLNARGLIQPRG